MCGLGFLVSMWCREYLAYMGAVRVCGLFWWMLFVVLVVDGNVSGRLRVFFQPAIFQIRILFYTIFYFQHFTAF